MPRRCWRLRFVPLRLLTDPEDVSGRIAEGRERLPLRPAVSRGRHHLAARRGDLRQGPSTLVNHHRRPDGTSQRGSPQALVQQLPRNVIERVERDDRFERLRLELERREVRTNECGSRHRGSRGAPVPPRRRPPSLESGRQGAVYRVHPHRSRARVRAPRPSAARRARPPTRGAGRPRSARATRRSARLSRRSPDRRAPSADRSLDDHRALGGVSTVFPETSSRSESREAPFPEATWSREAALETARARRRP